MSTVSINVNRRQYLELEKLAVGAFSPLSGFMTEDEFISVVTTMHLPGGQLFPLPVILDVSPQQALEASRADMVALMYEGQDVGEVEPQSVFTYDKKRAAEWVYGTMDTRHPGVDHWLRMGDHFIGGPVSLHRWVALEFSDLEFTPEETRSHFAGQKWQTVVGFQTRNVPHRAHEHLLHLALEQADGLFIQPLVGTKKRGDFTTMAVLTAYKALIEGFLPRDRVFLGVLSTTMRYAGPREALLHAIIRRNYGCSHFIVGRDHAGVGDFYGKYEAQELTRQVGDKLGIQVLRFSSPYYCAVCGGIVTEETCPHAEAIPQVTEQISGTHMREMLSGHGQVRSELMRPEIVASVRGLQMFIDEDAE